MDALTHILIELPAQAPEAFVERMLLDHYANMEVQPQAQVIIRLSDRLRTLGHSERMEQCVRELLRRSSASVERIVAEHPGDLHSSVEDQLILSQWRGIARLVSARVNLNSSVREVLMRRRDREIQKNLAASAQHNLDNMYEMHEGTEVSILARWCKTTDGFAEKILSGGPTFAYERFVEGNVGVETYLPRRVQGAADAHLQWLITTCTNQPSFMRTALERYLIDAQLSPATEAVIAATWGASQVSELETYVYEHLVKPADSMRADGMDAYTTMARRYGRVEMRQWGDRATLDLALSLAHTRPLALASVHLEGAALAREVSMVIDKQSSTTREREIRSREAGALAWNPNLTGDMADALSAAADGADALCFHHAPLSSQARAALLRRVHTLQELLCCLYEAQGVLRRDIPWVQAWFDRAVVEQVFTDDGFRDGGGSVCIEFVDISLDRYPDMLDTMAAVARVSTEINDPIASEIVRRISLLGDNHDAAATLSGLIAGWQGSVDQLIRTVGKL